MCTTQHCNIIRLTHHHHPQAKPLCHCLAWVPLPPLPRSSTDHQISQRRQRQPLEISERRKQAGACRAKVLLPRLRLSPKLHPPRIPGHDPMSNQRTRSPPCPSKPQRLKGFFQQSKSHVVETGLQFTQAQPRLHCLCVIKCYPHPPSVARQSTKEPISQSGIRAWHTAMLVKSLLCTAWHGTNRVTKDERPVTWQGSGSAGSNSTQI